MSRNTAVPVRPNVTRRWVIPAAAVALVVSGLPLTQAVATQAGTERGAPPATRQARDCPKLERPQDWYGANAARLQKVIDERGRCSWGARPPQNRPYAVFDWDNTVIKNDISDQTIFWMLRNDKILQPKGRNWNSTSQYMTTAGARALRDACGGLAAAGQPLPTSTDVRCADEILSVRKTGETTHGDTVFAGYHHRRMEASYAWVSQILAGYTPAQVRRIAAQARSAALDAPVGATQRVGSSSEVAWIRYYPQMRDLIRTLDAAGITPYVVSASPKEFADVWGQGVGIDRAHTLGIRQVVRNGRLTGHLKGCGGAPDGADSIMTYIDGKRCAINEEIVGITGARALRPAPKVLRPTIAGGDATTDVSMLMDATGARVVLNRNKDELMCRAYDNADGKWLVNPMFIQPLPRKSDPYPCATTAFTDANGNPGPVLRANGRVIPDQRDRVFG